MDREVGEGDSIAAVWGAVGLDFALLGLARRSSVTNVGFRKA